MVRYRYIAKEVRWLIELFFKKCYDALKKINKKITLVQFMQQAYGMFVIFKLNFIAQIKQ